MENTQIIKLGDININYLFDAPIRNGRTYTKEVFEKAIEEYTHKILLEERIKKLNKLNEKLKNRNYRESS
jgi:hypothetical protein